MFAVFGLALLCQSTLAYGHDGHEIILKAAWKQLTPHTQRIVTFLLGRKDFNYTEVATWADQVDSKTARARKRHFVEAGKCAAYNDARDCRDDNCIVTAFSRSTRDLSCSSEKSKLYKKEALLYVIHQAADISMPLHASGFQEGGTQTHVKYGNLRDVTLHYLWDSLLVRGRWTNKGRVAFDKELYIKYITSKARISHEDAIKRGWMSQDAILAENERRHSLAAVFWATDSNQVSCDYIWGAVEADPRQDFAEGYSLIVGKIVDEQLAKAAYRLAFTLNEVFMCGEPDSQ